MNTFSFTFCFISVNFLWSFFLGHTHSSTWAKTVEFAKSRLFFRENLFNLKYGTFIWWSSLFSNSIVLWSIWMVLIWMKIRGNFGLKKAPQLNIYLKHHSRWSDEDRISIQIWYFSLVSWISNELLIAFNLLNEFILNFPSKVFCFIDRLNYSPIFRRVAIIFYLVRKWMQMEMKKR